MLKDFKIIVNFLFTSGFYSEISQNPYLAVASLVRALSFIRYVSRQEKGTIFFVGSIVKYGKLFPFFNVIYNMPTVKFLTSWEPGLFTNAKSVASFKSQNIFSSVNVVILLDNPQVVQHILNECSSFNVPVVAFCDSSRQTSHNFPLFFKGYRLSVQFFVFFFVL